MFYHTCTGDSNGKSREKIISNHGCMPLPIVFYLAQRPYLFTFTTCWFFNLINGINYIVALSKNLGDPNLHSVQLLQFLVLQTHPQLSLLLEMKIFSSILFALRMTSHAKLLKRWLNTQFYCLLQNSIPVSWEKRLCVTYALMDSSIAFLDWIYAWLIIYYP